MKIKLLNKKFVEDLSKIMVLSTYYLAFRVICEDALQSIGYKFNSVLAIREVVWNLYPPF